MSARDHQKGESGVVLCLITELGGGVRVLYDTTLLKVSVAYMISIERVSDGQPLKRACSRVTLIGVY